jgi:hypothetical protein
MFISIKKNIMELLLKELNTTESNIGSKISGDKNCLQILKKYDNSVLFIVRDKVEEYQNSLFNDLVKRRKSGDLASNLQCGFIGGRASNLQCGFNIIEAVLKQIDIIIDTNTEKQLSAHHTYSNKKTLSFLLFICVFIFIIFLIFKFL